jgi:hypothetical protein
MSKATSRIDQKKRAGHEAPSSAQPALLLLLQNAAAASPHAMRQPYPIQLTIRVDMLGSEEEGLAYIIHGALPLTMRFFNHKHDTVFSVNCGDAWANDLSAYVACLVPWIGTKAAARSSTLSRAPCQIARELRCPADCVPTASLPNLLVAQACWTRWDMQTLDRTTFASSQRQHTKLRITVGRPCRVSLGCSATQPKRERRPRKRRAQNRRSGARRR